MAPRTPFSCPEVGDNDIAWATRILELPTGAFGGAEGNDPRLEILKISETLDVAACPGSGKTTLLVAKLAILARRWSFPRQGICVLSHTNVARQQVESRLGLTFEGRRLLGHPHFIGTIHGFVNTFIALPWLRSLGYPVRRIDDEIVQRQRWFKLSQAHRTALEQSGKTGAVLRIRDANFDLGDIPWGRGGNLGRDTPLYRAMREACRRSASEGDFCYEEMFVFAHDALDHLPDLAETVRERFPILFIDEVQDNSEAQASLLHRLFIAGERPSIRQRFGDMNQAIFARSDAAVGVDTDRFPDPQITAEIPNSHRFGQVIANIADPFGLEPVGLIGLGPAAGYRDGADHSPVMFLFDPDAVHQVLPSYARQLAAAFDEPTLRDGVFTAVGAVHRDGGVDRSPRSVRDYWGEYDYRFAPTEARPTAFRQYVLLGLTQMASGGDVYPMAEKVAEGLLRLSTSWSANSRPNISYSSHKQVLQCLSEADTQRRRYLGLISALAEGRMPLTREQWERWLPPIREIVMTIARVDEPGQDDGFLNWEAGELQMPAVVVHHENVYHSPEDPRVRIKVGSIHSVKGETHTATLVLDTFYYQHHLQRLKPWLLGDARGRGAHLDVSRVAVGLKQHYVAITRPTHMLALAMRREDFLDEEIRRLQQRGWRVGHVSLQGVTW